MAGYLCEVTSMITLTPAGMYGISCQECKQPYQYAVVAVTDDDWPPFSENTLKFICDHCARQLFPNFTGRPSGHGWSWMAYTIPTISSLQACEIFFTFLDSKPCWQR